MGKSNGGINKTCGNYFFRVDVGGSYGFNDYDVQYKGTGNIMDIRKAQVLEISSDFDSKTVNFSILKFKKDGSGSIERENI